MAKDLEKLAERVRKVRADTMQRHVLVCTDDDCGKGSKRAKQMRRRINGHKLRDRVTVTRVGCLDICTQGPICVVYPEGAWYHSVDRATAERIVDEHLRDGEVVEDAAFLVNDLDRGDSAAA